MLKEIIEKTIKTLFIVKVQNESECEQLINYLQKQKFLIIPPKDCKFIKKKYNFPFKVVVNTNSREAEVLEEDYWDSKIFGYQSLYQNISVDDFIKS